MDSFFREQNTGSPAVHVPVEIYLNSLEQTDQLNVMTLAERVQTFFRNKSLSGALVAVGRSVAEETRGTKRKDLDFVVIPDGGSDLQLLAEVARDLEEHGFRIGEVREPELDQEHGGSVMRHDGSITLHPTHGTSIELLPSPKHGPWILIIEGMLRGQSSGTAPRDFSVIIAV